MKEKYKLDVISQHPEFKDQNILKYHVDGIDTIGVWGAEPFEIVFTNTTFLPVQVKISLDGTDILTGQKASAQPNGQMWYVRAGEQCKISAWPENNEGGARFVFGNASDSVASHTHGDLSHKGIIAVAVFSEAYVPPLRAAYTPVIRTKAVGWANQTDVLRRRTSYGGRTSFNATSPLESIDNHRLSDDAPAIGAGETIQQKLGSTQGFRQPKFEQIVSLRYVWWDELKAKLTAPQHPSGFTDTPPTEYFINLGNTPRIGISRTAHVKG